jgi:SAM-dependent methyltransferase
MMQPSPVLDYYEVFEAALSSLSNMCGEYRRHFGSHKSPPPPGYCWFKGVTQPERHPDYAQWLRDAGTEMENLLLSAMPRKRPQRVLDVGCGNGALLRRLSRDYPGVELCGINLQPTQVTVARRLLAETAAEVVEADFFKHRFTERFDVACMVESAFHMPDKNALCRRLAEVLGPAGEAWLIDIVIAERAADTFQSLGRGELFSYVARKEWQAIFAEAGFEELELVDLSSGAAQVLTVSDIATLQREYFRPRLEVAMSDAEPARLDAATATMVQVATEYRRLSRLLKGGMLQYVLMRYRKSA